MPRLQDQIRRYILDNFLLGPEARGFADDDSLIERAIVDSTGFLEIIDFLEARFAIRIADEEMVPENLETLDRMARFLASRGVAA